MRRTINKKTKQLSEQKRLTELIPLVSHQLRTPLTAIKWSADLLLNGDLGELNAKQKRHIELISSANEQALNLITELLDVSRLEFKKFYIEPKPIDIRRIITNIIGSFSKLIGDKKLKLETRIDEGVSILNLDPRVLTIVFQNLLDNAIKYSSDGGQIYISLGLNKNNLLISVKDTGCGIPNNDKKFMFSKFFRAENARRSVPGGTGLGLYIVKKILDQVGGRIWFESKEKSGSNFHTSIPI